MWSYRILAAVLYIGGVWSFIAGVEQVGQAQVCEMKSYGMAKCKTAHSIPPVENGSGSYCAWVNNQCVKTTGSQCVDRWGLAVAGKCWVESLSTDPTHSCYENAYHTFVNVKWYAAHCEGYNGSCACKWEPSTTTQPMQVCECYDARNPQ